jgi:NAD(P)H-flavin reductase
LKSTPYVHVKGDKRETRFHKVKEKSDRLLEFCLKNRHPHFKPTQSIEVSNPDGSMVPTAVQPNTDNLTTEELEELIRLQNLLHEPPDPVAG